MTRLLSAYVILAEALHAQSNPVAAQFERLMGEPKELVNVLVNLPWNSDLNDFSDPEIVKSFESAFSRLLRFNGGGSSEIGYGILVHFINRTMEGSTWRTRQYNPTFEAQGRPQTWYEGAADKIEPSAGTHYNGPVYVLTSPSTCSAAEDFRFR
jgi:hypothetical protein